MQITYLHHSGFCVQLPEHTLIFDWVEGQLPKLDPAKPVVAFVSHFHTDHFTFDLFQRLAAYPQVHYVLGRDIRRQFSRRFFAARGVEQELYSRIHFVKGGETLAVAGLTVETLTSTDSGVAFLVSDGSHSLYHAGDLNWWLWAGEDAAFNRQMTLLHTPHRHRPGLAHALLGGFLGVSAPGRRPPQRPLPGKGGQGRMVSAISPRKPNKPKNGSALVRRCRSVFVPVMVWAVFRGG